MAKTYKLTTLSDVFEQVPTERIAACMAEMANAMKMARLAGGLMHSAAAALAPGGACRLEWPEVCEWTDDDDKTMEITFSDGQSDEVLTLTTQQAG